MHEILPKFWKSINICHAHHHSWRSKVQHHLSSHLSCLSPFTSPSFSLCQWMIEHIWVTIYMQVLTLLALMLALVVLALGSLMLKVLTSSGSVSIVHFKQHLSHTLSISFHPYLVYPCPIRSDHVSTNAFIPHQPYSINNRKDYNKCISSHQNLEAQTRFLRAVFWGCIQTNRGENEQQ